MVSVISKLFDVFMIHFGAFSVNKFQPTAVNDELMLCTKKLLQLLAMSQLIPPPLANLHTIIEHFEAPEVSLEK